MGKRVQIRDILPVLGALSSSLESRVVAMPSTRKVRPRAGFPEGKANLLKNFLISRISHRSTVLYLSRCRKQSSFQSDSFKLERKKS